MKDKKTSMKDKFKNNSKGSKSPSNFIDYLDLSKCKSHKLEKLNLEKGKDYLLGILPFTTKTDKCLVQYHPKKIYAETNEQTYHALVFVHSFLKFTNGNYICMKETYNKKCLICEYYEKLKSEGLEYDDIKHLRPKFRAIYIVIDDNENIKILDVANNLFEEKWQMIIEKKEKRGDDFFPVYVKEDWGRLIDFTVKDKGKGFYELDAFDFPPIEDYNKELAEHEIHIDDLFILPDIEKLQELIDNIGEVDEQEEEDEEIDEQEEHKKYMDEIEEEEEKPKKEKKEKKERKDGCPFGEYVFGKDFDEYKVCDECLEKYKENYEACKKASKE